MANYTITGSGSTASAVENGGAGRTTSGATNTVITTVIGWMSAGQKTEFNGSFTISGITISKASIILDFLEANLTFTSMIGFTISGSHITLLNGHLSGGQFAIAGNGCTYLLVQYCDIYGQSGGANAGTMIFNNSCINNQIDNCILHNCPQPMYFSSNSTNNIISNTDFYGFTGGGGHGIYMDGAQSTTDGNIEIYGCKFHDPQTGGNAIVMKSSNNKIHDNEFYNFSGSAMPFSIYTYSGYTETGNEIYNNNFHDCSTTEGCFWFGNVDQLTGYVNGTKIYSNTFTNCNVVFHLQHESSANNNDTRIYYNTFTSCTTIFRVSQTNVFNLMVAYNTFNSAVSPLTFETAYTNTMVTGNTGLADYNPVYNASSPYYIAPPTTTTPVISISATSATTITVGQSVGFSSTVTGGTSPYTVRWYDAANNLLGTGASINITFSTAGPFAIHAVATDSASQTSPSSNAVSVTVNPVVTQPSVTISATSGTTITAGGSVSFSSTVTGGTSPYTVRWYDAANNLLALGSSAIITFSSAGSYAIHAVATDSGSQVSPSSNAIPVTVNAAPTPPSVSISATSSTIITVGGSVSFSSTVTGGTAPYTVRWYDGSNNLIVTGASVNITFSAAGSYGIHAVATDNANQVSASSNVVTVTVNPVVVPPSVSINATSATTIIAGGSVGFSSTVTGGTSPYTVRWYDAANNLLGTGASINLTFPTVGSYTIHAVATDSGNRVSPSSNAIPVTVNEAPATTVTLNVASGANGDVSPKGTLELVLNSTYYFNATPNSGYHLDHWDLNGTNTGSTNPLPIVATSDLELKTLTALFTVNPPTPVTINIVSSGNGTTNLSGNHTFNVNDQVTFSAIPESGYAFSKWTLLGNDYADNPLDLVVTAAMDEQTLTAIFTSISPTPDLLWHTHIWKAAHEGTSPASQSKKSWPVIDAYDSIARKIYTAFTNRGKGA